VPLYYSESFLFDFELEGFDEFDDFAEFDDFGDCPPPEWP